jgi:hypothetical protein
VPHLLHVEEQLSHSAAPMAPVDEALLEDALGEALFVDQREIEKSEQKHSANLSRLPAIPIATSFVPL